MIGTATPQQQRRAEPRPVPCALDRHLGPFESIPELDGLAGRRLVHVPKLPQHAHHVDGAQAAERGLMDYASAYHAPVMVEEVMGLLRPERGGVFLDGTLGGGGHAEALLERGAEARLIGVDRDPDALAEAGKRLERFGERVRLVRSPFARGGGSGGDRKRGRWRACCWTWGSARTRSTRPARGFTFRPGAPLDMRMAQATAGEPSAADLLNELDEGELADVFYRYGEEKRSRMLARVIAEMRARKPFAVERPPGRGRRPGDAAQRTPATSPASSRRCASR